MADFLLELLSEEIPARMQEKAAADLRWAFETEMKTEAALDPGAVQTFAGPRRIAILAHGVQLQSEGETEEHKGPRVGAPQQAVDGFLKKLGLAPDALFEKADAKGVETWFAQRHRPPRDVADVLAVIVPRIVRAFPWPKSMRWGAASKSSESPRWVRPLQGIVALLDEAVVPCAAAGVTSGRETAGHRFMATGAVTIGRADAYAETLRAAKVIVDAGERQAIVRDRAEAAAREAGLALVPDEGLVAENAGLTEWPVPLLGKFDPAFLEVPREVIQLTMRTNQKYFACTDGEGALAPAFVCTANIEAADGGAAIVAGNARVLAARLADAQHFWEEDQWHHDVVTRERTTRRKLEDRSERLSGIVFHEKLGTVADKVARVAELAEWLANKGIVRNCNPALARRAAKLCKADLTTGMVGEFPELQGVIGGHLATAQGELPEVAAAIRDHYKPIGQGDKVPTAPVTLAVSLADKLDTLLGFFAWDLLPTGSKDPFALRRAALGVSAMIESVGIRLPLREIAEVSGWNFVYNRAYTDHLFQSTLLSRYFTSEQLRDENFGIWFERSEEGLWSIARVDAERIGESLFEFLTDRLKVQQREAGVRHDLIDAVFALGGEDDLVRLLARVKALQAFLGTEDGANLLTGYRRAANILRAEAKKGTEAGAFAGFVYDPDPAERALAQALDAELPVAQAAVADERFEAAMASLAVLRQPIDRFFDAVTVNDDDPERRTTRLSLLGKLVAAMHEVADFSKIEG